jgi:membrane protein DedA with SNARE-associated domain
MFGIDFSPEGLLGFFSEYAYQPYKVYGFIVIFMFLSAVGLPIPEELVLLSAGLVAHSALNPSSPPPPGVEMVDINTLMWVCFLSVLLADTMVFSIGKYFGPHLMRQEWMKKKLDGKTYGIVLKWFEKYGSWCVGIFRFTPGIRFPGHVCCGLMQVPMWKFLVIDSIVAVASVPTQVWLVGTYGDVIIGKIKEYQLYVIIFAVIAFAIWWFRKRAQERASTQP